MMCFDHVYATNEEDGLFECFSETENHEPFFIRVDWWQRAEWKRKNNVDTYEIAMNIAEHELYMWNGGFEELEGEEREDKYLYYHDGCYGEVVQNALEEAGIEYDIFYKEKRKDA